MKFNQDLLDSVDRWLLDNIRVRVIAIEVLVVDVHAVVAVVNAVRIDHGDQLENEVLSQDFRTNVPPTMINTSHGKCCGTC